MSYQNQLTKQVGGVVQHISALEDIVLDANVIDLDHL
jgi:hypothetical protein